MVNRPAELLSARFETAGLADIITRRTAEDSIKDVGALPLLSYTLDDMWTEMVKRDDGMLRLPAQTFELGGVLVDRADVFLATHPKFENELRQIFTIRLANVREGEEPTRRRALRSEFTNDEWRLVCELVDDPNRLLVTATPEGGETYAEVAHETIFRRWSKLRDWIATEHEFLAWKTGLEAARRAWQATPDGLKGDALLRGAPLAQAQSWLEKHSDDIPKVNRNFIDLSAERDSKARARARSTRALIFGMSGVLALLLLVFGGQWYFNWRNEQSWGSLTDLFSGEVLPLEGDSISIGRSAGAIRNMIDVPATQNLVSRLQLFVSRDGLALDARSMHGTTINARLLQYGHEKKLGDDDVIALAGVAAYRFNTVKTPLFPSLWRDGPKSSPPAQETWALLIDGKNRQTIALTKEEYFVSAGADESVTLNDKTETGRLLYIRKPTRADPNIVTNLAQDLFLTAMIKYDDHSYYSMKIPAQLETKVPQSIDEELGKLSNSAGAYISKVTFCFTKTEQPLDAVQMNPDDDISCDVGPLQIVFRMH